MADERRGSNRGSRLPRGQLFRQTELCVEMVVSEKLIGGFAFGVPRDSFLRFPFSPHFFLPILCHSTSGFSGSRARTEVERRERSERRGRKRKKGRGKRRGKSREDRLYSSAWSSSCTTCAFEPARRNYGSLTKRKEGEDYLFNPIRRTLIAKHLFLIRPR